MLMDEYVGICVKMLVVVSFSISIKYSLIKTIRRKR